MLIRPVTLFFYLLIPISLIAQSNYQPGYVVTAQGDTLNGHIDYKEWSRNPTEITFQSLANPQTTQQFNATTLRYMSVDGYAAYESFPVSISMDEVTLSRLSEGMDTSSIRQTVLLKPLLKGDRVSLYAFKDAIKTRFYVLERTAATPLELSYQQWRRGTQVITLAAYQQQLLDIANKYNALSPALQRLIQGASYHQSDLLAIVEGINQRNEHQMEQALDKKQKVRFFLSTGLNYNTLVYKGASVVTYDKVQYGYNVYKDHVTTHSYSPRFSAGIDWFANPAVQRLIFRGEISAFMLKSETATREQYDYPDEQVAYTYRLSALCISVAPQVLYAVYNQPNWKWYVGAGVSATFFNINQHRLYRKPDNPNSKYYEASFDDYFQMKDYLMNFVLRTNLMVHKKLDLSIIYFTPAKLSSASGSDLSINAGSVQLSVGYLFNKRK